MNKKWVVYIVQWKSKCLALRRWNYLVDSYYWQVKASLYKISEIILDLGSAESSQILSLWKQQKSLFVIKHLHAIGSMLSTYYKLSHSVPETLYTENSFSNWKSKLCGIKSFIQVQISNYQRKQDSLCGWGHNCSFRARALPTHLMRSPFLHFRTAGRISHLYYLYFKYEINKPTQWWSPNNEFIWFIGTFAFFFLSDFQGLCALPSTWT